MKRTKQILALTMVFAMILPMGVNAASTKTIGLKPIDHYSQEEIKGAEGNYPKYSEIEITNITKEIKVYRDSDSKNAIGVYEAEVGAEIRILLDNSWSFQVDKINLRSIEEQDFDIIKSMPVTGQIWVREYDNYEKDGQTWINMISDRTIDSKELRDNVMLQSDRHLEETISPVKGTKVVINEPGDYFVSHLMDGPFLPLSFFIKVVGNSSEDVKEETIKQETIEGVVAKPTMSKVLVNGKEIGFEAYNIDNNNYFKLRDIAKVVSGTEKQFEVGWDNENKVINLISSQKYTENGGELTKTNAMETKAVLNKSKILKDGKEVELTAYTIKGNNYFKLRDLAQEFDIGITWDQETKTIGIDTTISY